MCVYIYVCVYIYIYINIHIFGLSWWLSGKESACQCWRHGSCLGNPMDRGTWWTTIYGVIKNQTQLNNSKTYMYMYIYIYIYALSKRKTHSMKLFLANIIMNTIWCAVMKHTICFLGDLNNPCANMKCKYLIS